MSKPLVRIINHRGPVRTRDAPGTSEGRTAIVASQARRAKLNPALNAVQRAAGNLPSRVIMDDQIEETRRTLAELKRAVDAAVAIANAGLY